MVADETPFLSLIFSNEATFHLCVTTFAFCENVAHIKQLNIKKEVFQRASVFYAVSQKKLKGHIRQNVTGQAYIEMLQKTGYSLYFKQIQMNLFSSKVEHRQIGTSFRSYLKENVPQRWIGRKDVKDFALCIRPDRRISKFEA